MDDRDQHAEIKLTVMLPVEIIVGTTVHIDGVELSTDEARNLLGRGIGPPRVLKEIVAGLPCCGCNGPKLEELHQTLLDAIDLEDTIVHTVDLKELGDG